MPTRVFTEKRPPSTDAAVEGEAAASGVGEWRPVGETNGHTPKVVLVCSARPREGKTMTVANLAVCLAESGHTVLVLDSDLRAPQAHKLFGVQVEPGLSDVLSGSPDAPSLADVAQETRVPGVQVIAAGSRVANPGRLLARAADLVREAREPGRLRPHRHGPHADRQRRHRLHARGRLRDPGPEERLHHQRRRLPDG